MVYFVQTNSPPADGSYTNDFAKLSPYLFPSGSVASYIHSGGATNVPGLYYRVLLYQGPL